MAAKATTPILSATSVTVDGENFVKITLKPADSTYKHKIRYTFGMFKDHSKGLSIGSDFSLSGDVNVKFVPSGLLLTQIPNSTSGTCTITCYTYNSKGEKIGSEKVKLKLKVPDYTPTIEAVIKSNNLLKHGDEELYVENLSTITVDISATTLWGADIKSYSTLIDEKKYSGSKFTSDPLSEGKKYITITVTDTRGRVKTVPGTVTGIDVYEHSVPEITSIVLERGTGDNTEITATVTGSISPVNQANGIKNIAVKLSGGDYSKTHTINNGRITDWVLNTDDFTFTCSTTFTGTNIDTTYIASVGVRDLCETIGKAIAVLPTTAVTVDCLSSGKGIGIGKIAEHEDLLDIQWPTRFRNNFTVDSVWNDLNVSYGFAIDENKETNRPQYKNIGGVVSVRGVLTVTADKESSSSRTTMATGIPEECCPTQAVRAICQGSGMNRWVCVVTPDGEVCMAKHGVTGYNTISVGDSLAFNVTYIV